MDRDVEAAYAAIGATTHIRTRRGRVDYHYRMRACRALADPAGGGGFEWIHNLKAVKSGDAFASFRQSILTELGRLGDADEIRRVAAQICELKPKTREAVVMIRRVRLGRSPDHDLIALFRTLEHTIAEYSEAHPSATRRDMAVGLRLLADHIESEESSEKTETETPDAPNR